jgi:hypothetical protein
VTPMASRAAMKLWSRVSSKTKEKTPSSMSMKFSPCSSYYIMVNKSYASTVWLNCRLLFVQFVFGDMGPVLFTAAPHKSRTYATNHPVIISVFCTSEVVFYLS